MYFSPGYLEILIFLVLNSQRPVQWKIAEKSALTWFIHNSTVGNFTSNVFFELASEHDLFLSRLFEPLLSLGYALLTSPLPSLNKAGETIYEGLFEAFGDHYHRQVFIHFCLKLLLK